MTISPVYNAFLFPVVTLLLTGPFPTSMPLFCSATLRLYPVLSLWSQGWDCPLKPGGLPA